MGIKYYLKQQMEAKRREMVRSANEYGFTSKETVRYSQELDHLMNMYLRICVERNNDDVSLSGA